MAGVKDTTQRGSTHYWHKGREVRTFAGWNQMGGGGS